MFTFALLVLLQRLHRPLPQQAFGCPLTSACCAYAARTGQLTTLVWLREKGISWDSET
jgi:hypothetical protein